MEDQPHILVIQFRKSPEVVAREQEVYMRAAGDAIRVSFKNIFDDSHSWDIADSIAGNVHGIVLGGSGELYFDGGLSEADSGRVETEQVKKKIAPVITYIFDTKLPLLGVCFGHQLVGDARGVSVAHHKPHAKTGSHTVTLTDAGHTSPLMAGIPKEFVAQYGHKDSVMNLPEGAVVLVSGDTCAHAALWYGNHHYTVQFHPELSDEDMRMRMKYNPEYLPPGKSADELIRPSPHNEQILKNFFTIVQETYRIKGGSQ